MLFGSSEKYAKEIHLTSVAVGIEEVSGVKSDDQQHPLSNNSHRPQNEIDVQATEIATVRLGLKHTLDETWKLKEMLNPDQLVEAITKAISNMTIKESPKTSQGPQHKGTSNYVGRP